MPVVQPFEVLPSGLAERAGVPLKILFVTTKPPWPPIDGSRLLVKKTLEGLAARGHRITLVSPLGSSESSIQKVKSALHGCCTPCLIPAPTRSLPGSFLRSQWKKRPLSIDRHSRERIRRKVARLLDEDDFDLVHVEQLQALLQAEEALQRSVPVVLRAQNVESDLWAGAAKLSPLLGSLARREMSRLAAWEGSALGRVDMTIALTPTDAERLEEMAGGEGRIRLARVPFEQTLPAADRALPGYPAVVILGSDGWFPNRDAVVSFTRSAWPAIRARLPGARLHVFGNRHRCLEAPEIHWYPSPTDSRDAFAPGSVMVVPLRIASGVRMKILEAWARRIPVVALPQAAAGLDASHGRELLLASSGEEFATALERLKEEPDLRASLVAAGTAALKRWHDPGQAAARLEEIYGEVVASRTAGPRQRAAISETFAGP